MISRGLIRVDICLPSEQDVTDHLSQRNALSESMSLIPGTLSKIAFTDQQPSNFLNRLQPESV